MRAAILLCGQMRTHDHPVVMQSFRVFLQQFQEFDIFIATWRKRGISHNHGNPIFTGAEEDCVLEHTLFQMYPNVRGIEIHEEESWVSTLSEEFRQLYQTGYEWCNLKIKGTSVPQLFMLQRANSLRKHYEEVSDTKYDIVIRCRPDVRFDHALPAKYLQDLNAIYAINNRMSGTFFPNRIYDIFFYGSSNTMDILCEAYHHIGELIRLPVHHGLHPEDTCRILFLWAYLHKISVCDIELDICQIVR